MRKFYLCAALVACTLGPAHAFCPEDVTRDAKKITHVDASHLGDCAEKLEETLVEQRGKIELLNGALETAWEAFNDPMTLLEKLPKVSDGSYPGHNTIGLLNELRESLGNIAMGDAELALDAIEQRFAKPGALATTYETYRGVITRVIELKFSRQAVLDHLAAIRPLLEKRFDPLLAEGAYDWYHERCITAEEAAASYLDPDYGPQLVDPAACEHKAFADAFEKYYGAKPTPGLAYALSALHRRHLKGGTEYVSAWQKIGLDLIKNFAPAAVAKQ